MTADSSTPKAAPAPRSWRLLRLGTQLGGRLGGQIGRHALELLLPSTCRLCDACVAPGEDFCAECQVQLESSEKRMESACRRCGYPGAGQFTPSTAAVSAGDSADLGRCQRCRRESYAFDGCIALWSYDGLVRNAVVAAKYGSQVSLADALGRRLAERIRAVIGGTAISGPVLGGPVLGGPVLGDPVLGGPVLGDPVSSRHDAPSGDQQTALPPGDAPDLVTAVPSHLWRRIQRGAGGSRVLARTVAGVLRRDWPRLVHRNLLATTRKTKKQAWLGEKERRRNVEGAFCVSRPLWPGGRPSIAGRHILLIDDVMTTGATAAENAKVLKQAGARRVTVAVVARACS
ncbi:DNA utilization protein GntX [Stieleria maiorica]|uniref:DNA utilization protein GntX n=1 Tax=Stieleria maiorica TaxID=2795974 RepID=A0A5B9M738_9BACT|nr:phosphoribosyltransferase family protein [Stieleria maiorica]QEF96942.1 DNA utilization protein GntX [Stieleria maiorica]